MQYKDYSKPCKGCAYMGWVGGIGCCEYIFKEDKPRPCPPGKDCTVKKPRKRGRKKKAQYYGEV